MSELITKSEVIDTLRALVAEHGADTVRSSTYVLEVSGKTVPWCMAGCAFFAWGVSIEALVAVEGICVAEIALDWPLDGVVELTEAAEAVLHAAQDAQDSGATWGNALGAALNAAEGWGDEG